MDPGLYLVGTPIGNLGDFSPRGIETLKSVDFIAAEDTRVTMKLLGRFDIKRPLVSYHEHNKARSGEKIFARLQSGESCALVTDAGMPAVSDPGEELVRMCRDAGVAVTVIPGPSALIAAVAASGLSAGRFTFEGFLSTARRSRSEHLNFLKTETRAMVFYEAPHKLVRTLRDMLDTFGDREISVSRELTKLHEETLGTTLSEALAKYESAPPKGEFVLVISGKIPQMKTAPDEADAAELARRYIAQGVSAKDAARRAADETGTAKNAVYRAIVTQPEE
ncbi:MAG: 16S rRNA (cytidine(1402)-2'-O)-methyltransferase [Oscillospiraceae bacterium]|jgi:16S rRNA (cytidine1402-2'-O)-methyltransferase|nr:16S rRNA (cytidine(1402)-2'-O)-methyltransferase [Oscillospiraceae bacterium]